MTTVKTASRRVVGTRGKKRHFGLYSLFDALAEGLKQDYLGVQGLAYLPQLLTLEEYVKVRS